MPLRDLVEYFNQRIRESQGLAESPLIYRLGQVESRVGGLRITTELHPIRWLRSPEKLIGHDATLRAFSPETSQALANKLFDFAATEQVVNLDRLCRTIHMLNYLPLAHEDGYLFVHVHPSHVLGVKQDHGAYFEEIIFRCGLSPRRVAITVTIGPLYGNQLARLREGLKNYQQRGYSTAIRFDRQASEPFWEPYCIEFLQRVTPDFVRLDTQFFRQLRPVDNDQADSQPLLHLIRRLDTELLVEGIKSAGDFQLALALRPAYVKGDYLEQQGLTASPPILPCGAAA